MQLYLPVHVHQFIPEQRWDEIDTNMQQKGGYTTLSAGPLDEFWSELQASDTAWDWRMFEKWEPLYA
jgi:hypothetical protein